jgi:hypothetical protein
MRLVLLLILSFPKLLNAQIQDSVKWEVQSILTPGKHLVKELSAQPPKLTPQQIAVRNKVLAAIRDNRAWFQDSAMAASSKRLLEKIGLTPEDLKTYDSIRTERPPTITITGTDSLEIVRNGNVVNFKGNTDLDSLSVNLDSNSATFRGLTMTYKRKSTQNGEQSAFGSPVTMYQYIYESVDDPDNYTHYEFYIGRIGTTGEALLLLIAQKIVNRARMVNVHHFLQIE